GVWTERRSGPQARRGHEPRRWQGWRGQFWSERRATRQTLARVPIIGSSVSALRGRRGGLRLLRFAIVVQESLLARLGERVIEHLVQHREWQDRDVRAAQRGLGDVHPVAHPRGQQQSLDLLLA